MLGGLRQGGFGDWGAFGACAGAQTLSGSGRSGSSEVRGILGLGRGLGGTEALGLWEFMSL